MVATQLQKQTEMESQLINLVWRLDQVLQPSEESNLAQKHFNAAAAATYLIICLYIKVHG